MLANGRGYQEEGVASGWNLWVWLVSVVVRRYIILSAVKAESYLSRSRSDQLCISTRRNRGG